MLNFLGNLKAENNKNYTENGGLTNATSNSDCLDLFFTCGALRNASDERIKTAVLKAFAEDANMAMKIIFFARDVRGGLGERRFFRTAIKSLAGIAPDSINKNIDIISEYGRFDDLLALFDTPCEQKAFELIKKQLFDDIENKNNGKPISLLAKWLPSVNTSNQQARILGKKIAKKLGWSEKEYRQKLAELRKYTDIIENRLREKDYSFDYEKQTSGAMFKYRKAFMRNDEQRYTEFLNSVERGEKTLNASTLYPYQIVRDILTKGSFSKAEQKSLDLTWKNLYQTEQSTENAIAVIDGSGSMTWSANGNVRPIDVAISLGIYFAQHNKGEFANHFITFSMNPRLIEIKGKNIVEQVKYCNTFNECANTNIEKVFDLILNTAIKNRVPQNQLPSKIYIISDMEFDMCAYGGNDQTMFDAMTKKYKKYGYKLPNIIFWNVNSRQSGNIPVRMTQTGAALVSGATPAIFDMVKSGDISPMKIMLDILNSERYGSITA